MLTIKNEDVVNIDLLSQEEAEAIPQWILACGRWWWLRSPGLKSPGLNSDRAAFVINDGSVYGSGSDVNYDDTGVRPALQISNLPPLEVGETVKVFGKMAQYVGNDKVLLCEPIFESRFDAESNNYEQSEVKQKLDKWFAQMKGD